MIPGITDRPRLPRLGKIRLGEKRQAKSGKEYPAALDYFNFRDVPELEAVFGKGAKELYPVFIPVDEEDTWFVTSRAAYTRTGKFCQCHDGETALRVYKGLDEKTKQPLDPQGHAFLEQQRKPEDFPEVGEAFDLPCPGEDCWYFQKAVCKNLGRLLFLVAKSPRFGVYEIATSSINSIRNVLSTARAIKATTGRLTGIPLALKLVPLQVQPDGKAKTVYVLELEFRDGGLGRLLQMARRPAGQLMGAPEPANDTTPDDLYPEGGEKLGRIVGEDGGTPLGGGQTHYPTPTADDEPPPPDDSDLPFAPASAEENANEAKRQAERKQRTAAAAGKGAARAAGNGGQATPVAAAPAENRSMDFDW